MPLEELLRRREAREENLPALSEDRRNTGSLITQAAMSIGQAVPTAEEEPPGEPVICGDGYVRRSPVQEYRTPEDYRRKRGRRIIGAVLLVCLAALLVLALVRAGLLGLK